MSKDYRCAECLGEFVSERSDEDAHAESVENWGVRGDVAGMVEVCEDCYQIIMRSLGRASVPLSGGDS